ncbi:Trm112 family protein [candidate division WOR-3 bacterium]|nr:Trm112 family protein [candidate division WOR-3 bacterium]
MLDKRLLDILVCPKCKGELEYKSGINRLLCKNCKLAYKIEDDIPIMLIDEAERADRQIYEK